MANARTTKGTRPMGVSTSKDVAAFKSASERLVARAAASPAFAKKLIARIERPSQGTPKKPK